MSLSVYSEVVTYSRHRKQCVPCVKCAVVQQLGSLSLSRPSPLSATDILFQPPRATPSIMMRIPSCLSLAEHHSTDRVNLTSPLQHSITVQPSNQPKEPLRSLFLYAASPKDTETAARATGQRVVVPRRQRVIREANLAPLKACVTRYRTSVKGERE
jgi:hypothetical protein